MSRKREVPLAFRERVEGYRTWVDESIDPIVESWIPHSRDRRFEALTRDAHRRFTSDAWSRTYANLCPLPGIDHVRYQLRELCLPSGTRLLVGIHFRGQDMRFPFVGVLAQTQWLDASELGEAHKLLLKEFREFEPRATWWSTTPSHDLNGISGVERDQWIVMGLLEQVRELPFDPLPKAWVIERVTRPEGVTERFAEMYRDFHADCPELADLVPKASHLEMQSCAQEGVLLRLVVSGQTAGIAAARIGEIAGVNAWEMIDIILDRSLRGHGYARSFQRTFINELGGAGSEVIAGTIADANHPSWRAALSVGRHIVGGWAFVRNDGG